MPVSEFDAFYAEIENAGKKCITVSKQYVDRFCQCTGTTDVGFPTIEMDIG